MTYWDTLQLQHYEKMQARHAALWEYVGAFIAARSVHTVLEVGCGLLSPVPAWVDCYHGLDRNEQAPGLHGDFLTLDLSAYRGIDLLLAANVIEHMPQGWEPFLKQVLEVRPRHALVSFFNGLDRDQDYLRVDGNGISRNRYSGATLTAWLTARKVRHQFRVLGKRDTILWIQGE